MLNRNNPSTFYQIAQKYQTGQKIFLINLFNQEQEVRIDYGPNEDRSSHNQGFITYGCTLLSTQQKIYFIECLNPNLTCYFLHKFKKDKYPNVLPENKRPIFILDFAIPAKVQEIRLPEFMHCFIQATDANKNINGTYQLLKTLADKSTQLNLIKSQLPQVSFSTTPAKPAQIIVSSTTTKPVADNTAGTVARMGRYDPLSTNTATLDSEQLLETLITAMLKLSLTYYPLNTAESYFCRAAALVEYTKDAKLIREAVFVASLHKDGKIFHAEEVLARLLYQIYGNNPAVMKNEKSISVKCLFIDIEPCDGKRYGKSHHCREFFLSTGRSIVDEAGKKRNILLKVENLFWAANLPPAELNSGVRGKDPLHDYFLQARTTEQLISETFSQCYIANANLEPQTISLAQYFNINHQKQKDLAVKTSEIKAFLRILLDEGVSLDLPVKTFVASLLASNDDDKRLQALAENWPLKRILKYLSLSMAERKALQEIQDYYQHPNHIPIMKSIAPDPAITNQAMTVSGEIIAVTKNDDVPEESVLEPEMDPFTLALKPVQEIIDENIDLEFKLHSETVHKNKKDSSVQLSEIKELKEMGEVIHLSEEENLEEGEILEEGRRFDIIVDDEVNAVKDRSVKFSSNDPLVARKNKQLLDLLLLNKFEAASKLLATINDPVYYEQILIFRTKSNLSLLELLLHYGEPNCLNFYLRILHEAMSHNILSKKAFKSLLMNRSIAGLSPLHKVFISGNATKTIIYLAEIEDAKAAGILNQDDVIQLLTQSSVHDFTPLHEVLLSGNPENVRVYLETVKEATAKDLKQYITLLTAVSLGGFSPLHEVLISGHPENVRLYLETVKETLRDEPEHLIQLLIAPNKDGFTPLHAVLISGHSENVKLYLETIKESLADDPERLINLLVTSNKDGFTSLHSVLMSNPENVKIYFDILHELLIKDRSRYKKLLMTSNKKGFTPLHEVFIAKHPENAKLYFEVINEVLADDPDEFIKLLTAPNKAGFTPLHDALLSNDTEIVKLYLATVKEALAHGPEQFIKLLTAPNKAGFTPLHDVLISGHPENVKLYLATIKEAFAEDHEQFIKLLMKPNKDGFTSLHSTLLSNPENVKPYLEIINETLTKNPRQYIELLTSFNKYGFTPLHDVLISGNAENVKLYLNIVKKVLANDPEIYLSLLAAQNKAGFTPLHHVLLSGHAENVQLYLKTLEEALAQNPRRYIKLLTLPNEAGFTPLHEVLMAGYPKNVEIFLQTVKRVLAHDQEQIVKLLTASNVAGFTPLHDVLKSGNAISIQLYLEAIQPFVKKLGMEFLMKRNHAGYNLFHQAAGSGHIESLKLILDFVKINFPKEANDIITNLLWTKTRTGYLPSCPPQVSGSEDMNSYLMELRQKYFQEELQSRKRNKALHDDSGHNSLRFYKRQNQGHQNDAHYEEQRFHQHQSYKK